MVLICMIRMNTSIAKNGEEFTTVSDVLTATIACTTINHLYLNSMKCAFIPTMTRFSLLLIPVTTASLLI